MRALVGGRGLGLRSRWDEGRHQGQQKEGRARGLVRGVLTREGRGSKVPGQAGQRRGVGHLLQCLAKARERRIECVRPRCPHLSVPPTAAQPVSAGSPPPLSPGDGCRGPWEPPSCPHKKAGLCLHALKDRLFGGRRNFTESSGKLLSSEPHHSL